MIWPALILVFLITDFVSCQPPQLPPSLRIGGVFDEADHAQVQAFEHAIDLVNADKSLLVRTRLIAHSETIPRGDSFKASKKVCQMAALPGLTALLGPSSSSAGNHLQNMMAQMNFPLVETRPNYNEQASPFTLNIHPHPSTMGKAYVDLLLAMGWKSFVILFESEDSLIRLQQVLKLPKTFDDIKIYIKQLELTTDDYRPLLKEIRKSGETRIILDCHFDKIEKILHQADEIGLTSEYFAYLITSLDLERLDLAAFKYVHFNITGFRIVDTANTELVTEYVQSWPTNLQPKKGKNHPLYVSFLTYGAALTSEAGLFTVCQCVDSGRYWFVRNSNE